MDYMTLKEAAEKWGVTPRRVNYYCAAGRISGAVKMATIWLIPKENRSLHYGIWDVSVSTKSTDFIQIQIGKSKIDRYCNKRKMLRIKFAEFI